ncbi:hypothetical protein GDN83_02060 [Gordonia jinghuaiqii]|uniref:Uncharacterized protein n=1 Tax=Gordonia jinghuaiqii TaxID=2758710 RepID=A0A7D7QZT1_9ACTN|nr:hypothetical protein [Gordonia jinghuaiqii]MCR5976552.1 hypothetical protein [Gordonia jinghuaiqii]QMS99746.1 hypothetical protein H1R19_12135 [Gordonia jinghuaiqii]
MSTTELGCRSLFRIENDPELATKIHQQIYAWCTDDRKKWDIDKLTRPGVADIAPGVTASLVREERRDGSSVERWRFHQDEGRGLWITQLTTFVDRASNGWVLTDVLKPPQSEASVPRLVSNILEVAAGLDGRHSLTAEPFRARVDDVDYIYEALIDSDRRGFLFLAAADDSVAIPLPDWAGFVSELLSRTRGIASAYVLDTESTLALNARLPESHRVAPWSLRTYLPRPDFDDPGDSLRHRILTTGRIVGDSQYRIRDFLGRSACRHSTTFALPSDLIRIDRRLRELLDETIVGSAHSFPSTIAESTTDLLARPTPATPDSVSESTNSAISRPSDGQQTEVMRTLRAVVRSVIGTLEVTADSVRRLGSLASEALKQEENLKRVRSRIHTIQSERNALEDENVELTVMVEDQFLDLAQTALELDEAQRELRHLRGELARSDFGDVIWERHESPLDTPPGTFQELLDRFDELPNLVFTGQEKAALELDEKNPLDSWARKTWTALRALDDYCRLRSSGDFSGSVDDFLRDPPPGCVSFSQTNHARDETTATEQHPQYGRARIFAVPKTVDGAGKVFMGAHIKIAKAGSISPRLHYYNDAVGTGRIYIGYIGPHLPNFRTN